MPSTEDATLKLIQQEISEVVQREKELKEYHSRSSSRNGYTTPNGELDNCTSPEPPASLERTLSTSSHVTNGYNSSNASTNGGGSRLFTPNPTTKGVMQRFIKSRGKLSTIATLASNKKQAAAPVSWTMNQEFVEPPKPIVPTGKQPRNGFVPIEERMKKEFCEMQERETELRIERQKSQPDLLALLNTSSPEPEKRSLRSVKSISQLSDDASYSENNSGPSSLKTAKSLADLCNVDDEEEQPPGSLSLIKQWENLIQKNQKPLV